MDKSLRKKEEEKERKRIDVKEVDIIVEKEQHIISVLSWIIAWESKIKILVKDIKCIQALRIKNKIYEAEKSFKEADKS